VLLFLTVPSYGILAAAISYAATGLVLIVGVSVYAYGPRNPNTYRWRVIFGVLGAAALSYGGAVLTAPGVSAGAGCARLAWLALFAASVWGLMRADGLSAASRPT
jgi:hypothetical protein